MSVSSSWIVLVVAGLFEVGWAIGLKYTEGFTRLWPTAGTVASMVISVALLGLALKYLPVGQRVWQLAFTPDEKQLYTTNGTSNDVSVIDVENLKVVKSIPVGLLPWGVAITKK